MKRLICAALLSIALLAFKTEDLQAASKHPPVTVTFQVFYDQLSPYGSWVDYPGYGYAWIPSVGGGFAPYGTNGHWVYTDMGWTWASNYSWGWAPFHYGRWIYDGFYGWVWVPDYTWAPSWCVWGYYSGYYGWAPMAPGIYYSAGYRPPASCWTFVPQQHITHVNVYNYHVRNNTTIYNNVTIVNNTSSQQYYTGPRAADVEKNTGRPVSKHSVAGSSKPGATEVRNNQVTTYKPSIEKGSGSKPVPANARKLDNVKPVNVENRSAVPAKATTPGTGGKTMQQQKTTPSQGQQRNMPQQKVSPSAKPGVEQRSVPPQQKINQQRENPQQKVAPSQQQRVSPQPQQKVSPNPQQREYPQKINQQRENPRIEQRSTPPQQNNPAPKQQMPPQRDPYKMGTPGGGQQPGGGMPPKQGQPNQQMQPRQFNQSPAPQQNFPQQQHQPRPQPSPGGGGGGLGGGKIGRP